MSFCQIQPRSIVYVLVVSRGRDLTDVSEPRPHTRRLRYVLRNCLGIADVSTKPCDESSQSQLSTLAATCTIRSHGRLFLGPIYLWPRPVYTTKLHWFLYDSSLDRVQSPLHSSEIVKFIQDAFRDRSVVACGRPLLRRGDRGGWRSTRTDQWQLPTGHRREWIHPCRVLWVRARSLDWQIVCNNSQLGAHTCVY